MLHSRLCRMLCSAGGSSFLQVRALLQSPRGSIVISRHLSSFIDSQAHALGSTERPTDVSSWTKEQTTSWLSRVQPLEEDDKQVWDALRMDGKSLSLVTPDMLEKRGMGFGAALGVVSEIQKLLGQGYVGLQLAVPSRINPPVTLSTQYLSRLILNHAEFKRYLKKDPAKPVKLAINDANFKRVGRDDAMRTTVATFACRLYERTRGTGHDRQRNPLPATLTTTGGGKSFFLDELAALRPEDLEMIFGDLEEMRKVVLTLRNGVNVAQVLPEIMQEMKEILQNTVGVTITYNGGSDRISSIDDHINTSLGLALRMLHSYFIGPVAEGGLAFTKFVEVMEEQLGPSLSSRLTLRLAIECIAEHSKKGVLLLVDELMKSEPTVDKVVKQIGGCLDKFTPSQFNTVITTLNMEAIKDETKSGRYILWIPLLPAKYSDAIKLFRHVIDLEKQKPRNPKVQRSLAALEQCIADCNGHFRSLETLWRLWAWIKVQDPSYSTLIRQLGYEMESKYGSLKLPHVRAALLGKPVKYDAKVPGLPHTYGEYLEMGFFLNTIEGTGTIAATSATSTATARDADSGLDHFVPRVSPLQLLLFATKNIVNPDWEEYPYAKVILSMLDLEPNFTWQQYEHFHAHWETLIRLVLCAGAECTAGPWTIQKLYGGPKSPQLLHRGKFIDNNPSFYLSRRSADICEWPSHFPRDWSTNTSPLTFPTRALTQDTIIPALNNPGFDIVGFEDKRADGVESEPIVICTECRFSDPDATTKLNKAEVDKKRDLTVDQFAPYLKKGECLDGLTIKKENLFLVVCAFRDVNANAIIDLPQNTMVLNRDMLKTLYTPSLASRPQFILPLKKGESTQVPE